MKTIKKIICRLGIHNYVHSHTNVHRYFECKWCGKRHVIVNRYLNLPVNQTWLTNDKL